MHEDSDTIFDSAQQRSSKRSSVENSIDFNGGKLSVKTVAGMTYEEFCKLEEKYPITTETFEDPTLDRFVRKEESWYDKIVSEMNFILLFAIFCIICAASVISSAKGAMENYVAIPIAILSMIGIFILAKSAKK